MSGSMDMKSIQAFHEQNPNVHFKTILLVGPGVDPIHVVNFSHMTVREGFEDMEQIARSGMLMTMLTGVAGWEGNEGGMHHNLAWSNEHDFLATEYEFNGSSIVYISANGLRSRPILLQQDFPSTCLDSIRPCGHCCCS